ncbi:MAG: PQQ-binding-like beta-propeller repeat protein [Pseudomonadota bacterium]
MREDTAMAPWRILAVSAAYSLALAACGPPEPPRQPPAPEPALPAGADLPVAETVADVDTGRILAALERPDEWLTHGGTYDEARHAPLQKINRDTAARLGVAWTYDFGAVRGGDSTPLIVDGTMYVTSAGSVVHALDAQTGAEIWVHRPALDRAARQVACCAAVNRGAAVYGGRVYVGLVDGRLQALDAKTGALVWSTVTVDQSKPYTITGAPRVVDGRVLIGNGGAGPGLRGYLSAYDAGTGKRLWRFYTAPDLGGGAVSDALVFDPVNDQVIFGVGPGARDPAGPDPGLGGRGGDGRFSSSIVAVDVETGAYHWHVQTGPGDAAGLGATQSITLAQMPLGADGALRRVVVQAPEDGAVYVVDAATGELISNDAIGAAAAAPDAAAGEGDGETALAVAPARAWHPMAFNPELGLAYIPMLDGDLVAWDVVARQVRWRVAAGAGGAGGALSTGGGLVFQGQPSGAFTAYDAATGEDLWRYDLKSGGAAGPISYEIDGDQCITIVTGLVEPAAIDGEGDTAPLPTGKVVTFKLGGNEIIPGPGRGLGLSKGEVLP